MCGILGIFDVAPGTTQSTLRAKLIECARRMRHRGPDWSGYQLISQGKDKQELGAGQHASSESLQRLCIAEHGVRGAAKHDLSVPRCCGAFTPSTRVVSRRGGRGWFLFRF